MNRRLRFAVALCAACVAPAFAQEGQTTLSPIQVNQYIADCAHLALPTQHQVGEWAGLQNFGQVYAARASLMGEIGRACQQPGVGRVRVVQDEQSLVAVALQAR